MATKLTYRGTYFVPSTIAGKKDVKEFSFTIKYPLDVDEEATGEADFFVKRFIAADVVKKQDPENFYGIHTCYCYNVAEMTEEEIAEAVEKGEMKAIDQNDITASEVRAMKKTREFVDVLVQADTDHLRSIERDDKGNIIKNTPMYNDVTDYVASTLSMWQGTDVNAKRAALIKFLQIEETEEKRETAKKKRKSALAAASTKKSRPARTKEAK